MLLIMSDLHFVDGTAGEHNLSVKAYEKALNIPSLVNRITSDRIKELRILFLGDIFDVIRTTNWFVGDDTDVRPWENGSGEWDPTDKRIQAKTQKILDAVLGHKDVKATSDLFLNLRERLKKEIIGEDEKGMTDKKKADLAKIDNFPISIHYLPGNHDRFMRSDAKARAKAKKAIGFDYDPEKDFGPVFSAPDYGVVAFHGQETDMFNFGGVDHHSKAPAFEKADYDAPSIGEVITVEIASRIPFEVEMALKKEGRPDPEIQRILKILRNMDNVRPVEAVFPWLDQVIDRINPSLRKVLNKVIKSIFEDFATWEYVKQWSNEVDQRYIPDSASWWDKARAKGFDHDFDEFMKGITSLKKAKKLHKRVNEGHKPPLKRYHELYKHRFYEGVLRDALGKLNPRVTQYLVYGHTHDPMVLPIRHDDKKELTLINTGTFRPRVFACLGDSKKGFVTHKTLSYVVFYRDDEELVGRHQKFEFHESRLSEV